MESASGSAFRVAPAEEEADVKIPVGWKNLLSTACLAGAGRKGACAAPEAGFGRGIAGPGGIDPAERRKGRVVWGVAALS